MRSPEQDPALPGRTAVQGWLTRLRQSIAATPLWIKILLIIALPFVAVPLVSIALFAGLIYAPYALWRGERSPLATACVALWGIALVAAHTHGLDEPRYLLLLLPPVVAILSHVGVLGRWSVPCRTTGWVLLWSLPIGVIITTLGFWHSQAVLGPATAWLIALAVLGWRLAKAMQGSREYLYRTGFSAAPAPHAVASARPGGSGGGAFSGGGFAAGPGNGGTGGPNTAAGPGIASPTGTAAGTGTVPSGPGGAAWSASQGAVQAAQTAGGVRNQDRSQQPRAAQQATTQWPHITVDDAMAELTAMVGLTAVKNQIRSITASVEAARRRAIAGHGAEKPMQHFVFLGPPGTGKTAVARIVAKIFYAFGLLDSPAVVEAQRADLVGEYLGATAIKTNQLIDSALGGVLFIDEAYSLVNEADGQGDRFGNEAVQALLKRAEDDRENLIIILAGYERQMETFLSANPGLNSRFAIRVKFPTYSPAELMALTEHALADKSELLDPDARPVLREIFDEVGRRRLADELGNGRFVRSLLTRAGQQRDVRVMDGPAEPTPAELVTLRGEDLQLAYAELTTRFRGYTDTPSVDGALAELDALVGLEPVKRQVHEIVAQLQVARLRDRQGLASQPPSRHFVFTGPPGTGKTTVARIIGRIFAALGLLVRPEVIEAHRGDLVGEHLGSTAIKTSKLIDSAMGGVLFIDEAYALHNDAYSGGDAFGSEAVATLLKRAEDDRERLVIVLAGYTDDMERLLRSNPGLASRFSTRITFPSYTATELSEIAQVIAANAGDAFDADALPELQSIFAQAVENGRIDVLGNGRFARSLFERACASRDVRVSLQGEQATTKDLTTVLAPDLLTAYRELTS
ncbi:MAG TPA: AAA family ATPase [Streptosporangiaceae bacterium]|nr:AAA family ATPase [Streptosporangiaceae bacterium]